MKESRLDCVFFLLFEGTHNLEVAKLASFHNSIPKMILYLCQASVQTSPPCGLGVTTHDCSMERVRRTRESQDSGCAEQLASFHSIQRWLGYDAIGHPARLRLASSCATVH